MILRSTIVCGVLSLFVTFVDSAWLTPTSPRQNFKLECVPGEIPYSFKSNFFATDYDRKWIIKCIPSPHVDTIGKSNWTGKCTHVETDRSWGL